MGLFSFLKKKEMFDKSLMLFMCVFDDANPALARQVNDAPIPTGNALFEKHAEELIRAHYYEALRPPVKWNFNFIAIAFPTSSPELRHLIFWEPGTNRIVNQAVYRQTCSDMREYWKGFLLKTYPDYDRNKLEDGMENIVFDYYPADGLIIGSMVLEKILPMEK